MTEFFIRTEDMAPTEVLDYFAESKHDRSIIDALKDRQPTILIGSRGVGKSFLMRVAEQELARKIHQDKIVPCYMSFNRSSMIYTQDNRQFQHWMLARIASAIARSLSKHGIISKGSASGSLFAGADQAQSPLTSIEAAAEAYENSWRAPETAIDASAVPTVDDLKAAVTELEENGLIKRVVLFIDEAAHILRPEQQRQFFTLFRDLRTYCITCSAAVYPGVTSYGDVFQPAHDAKMLNVDRDITSSEYVTNMREIVDKQADSALTKTIAQSGENFAILAYAASGNPRMLLKTIGFAKRLNSTQVNEVIREFYRTGIWSEHSLLGEKYKGHQKIIDWGRTFIEGSVLPDIKAKNDQRSVVDKSTSAFFWLHRDVPNAISEAVRMLSYTGIICRQDKGIKATRGEIGTRYMVNLGCLFSMEATPASTANDITRSLAAKRMTEFGSHNTAFKQLEDLDIVEMGLTSADFKSQLRKPTDILDLSSWQQSKLRELGLMTVEDVLLATEEKLKEAMYVGNKRARQMRNAAIAAVLEYLSG